MKETILGIPKDRYRRGMQQRMALCAVGAVAVLALNILLLLSRTEQKHSTHLLVNILTGIAAAWVLMGYARLVLMPRRRLYRLACSNHSDSICGTVQSVSPQPEYQEGLRCLRVQVDGRMLFLPCDGALRLKVGRQVKLQTVGHFITEAEQ